MAGPGVRSSLLCRAGNVVCVLPVDHVIETMRPLPLEELPGAPPFVAGMAIVRGGPIPVIVVNRLLGKEGNRPDRFIIVRVEGRRVGLAVDAVIGVRALSSEMLERLPPLFRDAVRDAVSEIGALDGELMVVLEAARVTPAEVFAIVEAEAAGS